MRVLYVEDNKINAVVMDKMISKEVSKVIIAENGLEALKIAREEILDLILVDINLGVNQMDGCEVLKRLRQLEIFKSTPIYAVTAYAMPGDSKKFLDLGFDKYFSKPVKFEELITTISQLKRTA